MLTSKYPSAVEQKFYRVLVRVTMMDYRIDAMNFVVPSWDSVYTHTRYFESLPCDVVEEARSGRVHFFTWMNLGCEEPLELIFKDWEV